MAELQREFDYAEEGIVQMGEAWERGEYKDDPDKYERDVKNNAEFMQRYEKQMERLRKEL